MMTTGTTVPPQTKQPRNISHSVATRRFCFASIPERVYRVELLRRDFFFPPYHGLRALESLCGSLLDPYHGRELELLCVLVSVLRPYQGLTGLSCGADPSAIGGHLSRPLIASLFPRFVYLHRLPQLPNSVFGIGNRRIPSSSFLASTITFPLTSIRHCLILLSNYE
jgi:hypothetical protein